MITLSSILSSPITQSTSAIVSARPDVLANSILSRKLLVRKLPTYITANTKNLKNHIINNPNITTSRASKRFQILAGVQIILVVQDMELLQFLQAAPDDQQQQHQHQQLWWWAAAIIPTVLGLIFVHLTLSMVQKFVLVPRRVKRVMERQGVTGPPPQWILGNTAERRKMVLEVQQKDMDVGDYDIVPRIVPFHVAWTKQYGKQHLWWFGRTPLLTLTDPQLIKEVLLNKNGFNTKSDAQVQVLTALLGKGLVSTVGEEWSLHRRIVSPAFHHDRIKHMLGAMVESTVGMLENLEKVVDSGGGSAEVEMEKHLENVTADIISRTAFGSSYKKGTRVFEEQHKLYKLLAANNPFMSIPLFSGLPTPANLKIARQQKVLKLVLTELIQGRKDQIKKGQSETYGHDLLGLMILAADEDVSSKGGKAHFDMQALIDECKTFYVAGQETTSTLLTWTVMLLGTHTEWQDRARAEVLEVCGDRPLDTDAIGKLKVLTMILNESLRLFPPVPLNRRFITRDVKLGDLELPKDLGVWLPVIALHHDPDLWGDNYMKFQPERFSEGTAKVGQHQLALLPFSFGPRTCVGHTFAMQEAKVIMAMLLRQFRFRLSPQYRHTPTIGILTLAPQHGMPLVVEKVGS